MQQYGWAMYFLNIACTMPEAPYRLADRSHGVRGRKSCRAAERILPHGVGPAAGRFGAMPVLSRTGAHDAAGSVRISMNRADGKFASCPTSFRPIVESAVETGSSEGTASPALGVHEVIIESSRHVDRLSSLSVDELQDVLQTYAQRLRHWRADGRFAYGLVFKNQGPRAGRRLPICTASSLQCRRSHQLCRAKCTERNTRWPRAAAARTAVFWSKNSRLDSELSMTNAAMSRFVHSPVCSRLKRG